MVALSDRKISIVRTLVESAPDKIVGGLQRALAESAGDSVLADVRTLVEAEARDRMLRNAVFQPIAALCVGDANAEGLNFPAQSLSYLWRGLKAVAPDLVEAAVGAQAAIERAIATEQRLPDPTAAFDAAVKRAAEGLRARESREFRMAAEACDQARPGGGEQLAACLDISQVVRRTLPKLSEWIAQSADLTSAPARLAYKDAVAVAPDAGPRFFEMLAAQMAPPWMVLRIISAIMDKPTERYLAESEVGGFAEGVMSDIDATLKAVGKLDLDGGAQAGRAAGRRVALATEQFFELDTCIELNREHGWGKRIVEQKRSPGERCGSAPARRREADH